METKEVTGLVQAIKQGENGRYALCIGERWLSGFADVCPVRKGDTATVGYSEVTKSGRTYYNIAYVAVAGQSQRSGLDGTSERIARSVALKAACMALTGNNPSRNQIFDLAEALFAWLQEAPDNGVSGPRSSPEDGQGDEASASSSQHYVQDKKPKTLDGAKVLDRERDDFDGNDDGTECPQCGKLSGIWDRVRGKTWPCVTCLKELAEEEGDDDGFE